MLGVRVRADLTGSRSAASSDGRAGWKRAGHHLARPILWNKGWAWLRGDLPRSTYPGGTGPLRFATPAQSLGRRMGVEGTITR